MNTLTAVMMVWIAVLSAALAITSYMLLREKKRNRILQNRLAQIRAKAADRKNRDSAKAAHQTCLVQEQLDLMKAELARRDLELKALRLVLRKADEQLAKLRNPVQDCTTSTAEASA